MIAVSSSTSCEKQGTTIEDMRYHYIVDKDFIWQPDEYDNKTYEQYNFGLTETGYFFSMKGSRDTFYGVYVTHYVIKDNHLTIEREDGITVEGDFNPADSTILIENKVFRKKWGK